MKALAVAPGPRHTIHTYYNLSPESPDGRFVLFFSSAARDAGIGDVRIIERATGRETILAAKVKVEDAHRAACQQWAANGRYVVYHAFDDEDRCHVCAVDVATGRTRALASDRHLGFGQASLDFVPLCHPHWKPGPDGGLEIINVVTGEVRATGLTPSVIRETFPEWVNRRFGHKTISVAFAALSPDGKRAMFKVGSPGDGNPRGAKASIRLGLLCYDLERDKLLSLFEDWGHPAWHPDSRWILNNHLRRHDSETGKTLPLEGWTDFTGSHPSYSADGRCFTTDACADCPPFHGPKGSKAVVVGDAATGTFRLICQVADGGGARSWRRPHAHPVFSPDGRRLYFNVSEDEWTRLYVAEVN